MFSWIIILSGWQKDVWFTQNALSDFYSREWHTRGLPWYGYTHTGKAGRMGVGDRLDEGNVLDSPVNKNELTRYFVTKQCERLDRWKQEIRSRLNYCKHRAMLCRAPLSGIISVLAAESMSAFPKQPYHYFYDLIWVTGKANQLLSLHTTVSSVIKS